jgi:hypothetical protein
MNNSEARPPVDRPLDDPTGAAGSSEAFPEKGPEKLLEALQKSPKVGYIRLPNTLAWDLRYAFEMPLPEGGRRVVLATDRPIGFEEARTQPRRIDYPFTLLEIRFNKEGLGPAAPSGKSAIRPNR